MMRPAIAMIFGIIIISFPCVCLSENGIKIKPISGIVLICEDETNTYCNDSALTLHIRESPIKFLDRSHLKTIFDEKSLNLAGLTHNREFMKNVEIWGASHLLLYRCEFDPLRSGGTRVHHDLKLINISTSEIEYVDNPMEATEAEKRALVKYYGEGAKFGDLERFFSIINSKCSKK